MNTGQNSELRRLFDGVDGVLFDLDGVLLDSTAAVHRHWTAFADWQGIERSVLLRDVHGRRAADVIADAGPSLSTSVAEAIRWHEELECADQEGIVALPGALDVLTALAAASWAVVTSGTRAVAAARMRAAGLPAPVTLVAADHLDRGKPHPDPYLAGARGLGLPAARCLAVEDSVSGLAAARAAGCRLLALATTTDPALLQAPLILPDLSHVVGVLPGHLLGRVPSE